MNGTVTPSSVVVVATSAGGFAGSYGWRPGFAGSDDL